MIMISCRVVPAMLILAAAAPAQSPGVVDEGTFTFTRAGAPYGTESFKIVRRLGADGTEYAAQCTRAMEGRIVKTTLTTDSSGYATMYSRSLTGGTSLTARRALNRLMVNEEGPQASSRDYVFAPGSVVLDDDVIHHLYFVTWKAPRGLGYVAPGARTSGQARLTEVGSENVVVGGRSISATRLSFGAGDDKREIWIDSGKRLLKVSFPARQIIGTRDLPPR